VGTFAKANAAYCYAIGYLSYAANNSAIAFGDNATATGNASVALGPYASATTSNKTAIANSCKVTVGDSQRGLYNVFVNTSSATPAILTGDGTGTILGTNQVTLPNNSAYAFDIILVARQSAAGGTASAAWNITGLIRREASAATTTLVTSTTTVISNVPGWSIALSADTTVGALALTATGAAATDIRWVAAVTTSEVVAP